MAGCVSVFVLCIHSTVVCSAFGWRGFLLAPSWFSFHIPLKIENCFPNKTEWNANRQRACDWVLFGSIQHLNLFVLIITKYLFWWFYVTTNDARTSFRMRKKKFTLLRLHWWHTVWRSNSFPGNSHSQFTWCQMRAKYIACKIKVVANASMSTSNIVHEDYSMRIKFYLISLLLVDSSELFSRKSRSQTSAQNSSELCENDATIYTHRTDATHNLKTHIQKCDSDIAEHILRKSRKNNFAILSSSSFCRSLSTGRSVMSTLRIAEYTCDALISTRARAHQIVCNW